MIWKNFVSHFAMPFALSVLKLHCMTIICCRRCYIRFIRKVNDKKGIEGQEETRKAFDFMLTYVGMSLTISCQKLVDLLLSHYNMYIALSFKFLFKLFVKFSLVILALETQPSDTMWFLEEKDIQLSVITSFDLGIIRDFIH